jgi:hypothetical protein
LPAPTPMPMASSIGVPPPPPPGDMPPSTQLSQGSFGGPGSVQTVPSMQAMPGMMGPQGMTGSSTPPPGVSTDVPAGMRSPAGPTPIAGY